MLQFITPYCSTRNTIERLMKLFYERLELTLNRPGFLQIDMAGGGQILPPPPLCSFCLNGPIDLKFGMWILGKISRYKKKNEKNCQDVAQNVDISIF